MLTPSLPNHADLPNQIDYSRNNAIFLFNFRFQALKYVELSHQAFPLGGPVKCAAL